MLSLRSLPLVICMLLGLHGCSSEEARTQITLMIDADPVIKSQLDRVHVELSSAAAGSATSEFVARPTQSFTRPFTWPLVVVLVPMDDDANRTFRVQLRGEDGQGVIIEASARSQFVKGRNLALRMHLHDDCRVAVFGRCSAGQTCSAVSGEAACVSELIDPSTLPDFSSVDGTSDAGIGTDANTPVQRTVTGRVFSTEGLVPLAGARIAIGGTTTLTGGDGLFSLQTQTADLALTISHSDHAPATKALPPADGIYVEVITKRVDARGVVPATTGGIVVGPGGSAVTFPPGAFKTPAGVAVTGMADVTLTAPNTKDPVQAQSFPGEFPAEDATGKQGALSTFSTLDITATASNQTLTLDDGKEADVSFPAHEVGARPTTDLWSFDTQTRQWKFEGLAVLTRDITGQTVYRAKISHLSWWAVGELIEETDCVSLCAEYNGNPAPYARVTITGNNPPFHGAFYTDATGCGAFDVPLNTQVTLLVQTIEGTHGPQLVVTRNAPASRDEPATCQQLGAITITERRPEQLTCPGGTEACGPAETCTDTRNDPLHCGGCNAPACRDSESCVNGACGCAYGETLCGQRCVNTRGDSMNCGACGATCTPSQRCSQSRCVDVLCPVEFINCNGICVSPNDSNPDGTCPGVEPTLECTAHTDCPDDMRCGPAQYCEVGYWCRDIDCAPGEVCNDNDQCMPVDCGGGPFVLYCRSAQACVDTHFSHLHCGMCDRACANGLTCMMGMCIPPPPVCGNGVLEPSEMCDDGNTISGDGCSASCQLEPGYVCHFPGQPCVSTAICGDSILEGDEECDDGNTENDDGCDEYCRLEGPCMPRTCAHAGANCGLTSDGCGGILNCGDCPPPQTCGGGGMPNVCDVAPSGMDPCDGLDNDQDGWVDEGHVPTTCGSDVGDCVYGMTACMGGTIICLGGLVPSAETCDGRDNDCDGMVDENASTTCSITNGTATCIFGACVVSMCNPGWGDCDGFSGNGCERSLTTPSDCGACDNVCIAACVAGTCL